MIRQTSVSLHLGGSSDGIEYRSRRLRVLLRLVAGLLEDLQPTDELRAAVARWRRRLTYLRLLSG